MDTKTIASGITLVIGVVLISVAVSLLMNVFYGKPKTTTVIVERPWWNNYRGWWGHYGGGLPGWGGHHPQPKPPMPSSPPPPPPSGPPPASPPPSNPPA